MTRLTVSDDQGGTITMNGVPDHINASNWMNDPIAREQIIAEKEKRRTSVSGQPVKQTVLGEEGEQRAAKAEVEARNPWETTEYGIGRTLAKPIASIEQAFLPPEQKGNFESGVRMSRNITKEAPWTAIGGETLGNVLSLALPISKGAQLVSKALPAAAPAAVAPIVANTVAGGAQEALAPTIGDESRVGNAARGAAVSLAAGGAGEAARKVLPKVAEAITGANKQPFKDAVELAQEGVRVPVEKSAPRVLKTTMERMRKFPITGGAVKKAETQGFTDANAAMVNRATPPRPMVDEASGVLRWEPQEIKKVGPDAVKDLSNAFDDAYDAIYRGRTIPLDETYLADKKLISDQVKNYFPGKSPEVEGALKQVDDILRGTESTTKVSPILDASGKPFTAEIPGHAGVPADAVKDAISAVQTRIDSAFAAGDGELANYLKGIRMSLQELRERGLPPEVAASAKDVNKAYRSYVQYREAMANAPSQSAGMASPRRMLTAAMKETKGKTNKAAGTGENVPFLTKVDRTLGSELPTVGPGTGEAGVMGAMVAAPKVMIPMDAATWAAYKLWPGAPKQQAMIDALRSVGYGNVFGAAARPIADKYRTK